jgi:hypothetical protein
LTEIVAARDQVAQVALPDLQVTVGDGQAELDGKAAPSAARVEVG